MQLLATEWICTEKVLVEETSKTVTLACILPSPGPTLSSFLALVSKAKVLSLTLLLCLWLYFYPLFLLSILLSDSLLLPFPSEASSKMWSHVRGHLGSFSGRSGVHSTPAWMFSN